MNLNKLPGFDQTTEAQQFAQQIDLKMEHAAMAPQPEMPAPAAPSSPAL